MLNEQNTGLFQVLLPYAVLYLRVLFKYLFWNLRNTFIFASLYCALLFLQNIFLFEMKILFDCYQSQLGKRRSTLF